MRAIRNATVADARSIAEVHADGWSWGFRGMVPDDIIDATDVDSLEQMWITGFTADWREGDAAFVAEDDTHVIGVVAGGPAADEYAEPPADAAEVYFIYVRDEVKGQGVGWRLLQAIERALRENGYRRAVLWVFENNARARSFYERSGWICDGTRGEHRFDYARVPLVRYTREL